MAQDPYRPIYHMSSLSSMGDPNGLCQWQGRYHLFYQFGPEGSDRCHWGHCYAHDLVHWQDLPPALYPDTELHCFSGQTLVEDDRVVAIYHGKESGNSIATATDPLLLNWEKHPDNPVIPNPKTDAYERPYNVFDPCIWKEEDGYYSISGTSIDGYIRERRRSASHLFYSKDLSQWKYLHPLLIDDVFCDLGEDGAVPNFLPIGHGKHILLLFSHKRAARYYIGEYDRGTHRFTPEYHGRINHGPFGGGHVACPSATIDSNGRCITILNCADGRQGPQSEWGRCMTLPWQLSLKEDTMLAMEPVDEVKSLRYNHNHFADIALSANEERVLDPVGGKAIELDLTVEMGTAREVGVHVLRSPDGRERTKISIYNHGHPKTNDSLQIDTSGLLPCGPTSLANRQRPLRSTWERSDGYSCASSSIGASSKFSRTTGSARQNGRFRGKGSTKFSRCSPDNVPLRVLIRSGKTATASLYSQSGAKRRLCRWMYGRCGQSGPS